jgi:hypothetical protein
MNSIEIQGDHVQKLFFRYLSNSFKLDNNPNKVNNTITNFFINIDSDKKSSLYPAFGEFNWIDIDDNDIRNEFILKYFEEGDPCSSCTIGIGYFTRLRIYHSDINILQAFITKALTYEKLLDINKIHIFSSTSKGYWDSNDSQYAQDIDTIYIPNETKAEILEHIDTFISIKEKYIRYGKVHKTGFLLCGNMGAGKTSLAKSMAMKYKRPIYVLNFTAKMTDENLIELISNIKNSSILLIEDIDAFFLDRQSVNINISFSALINILDGTLSSMNDVIIFMTANNPDRLDSALIRPGRIDKIIKFDYPKKREIKAAFDNMIENPTDELFETFYKNIRNLRITMSGIIDYFFRNPISYIENVNSLINQTQILHEITNDKTDKMFS